MLREVRTVETIYWSRNNVFALPIHESRVRSYRYHLYRCVEAGSFRLLSSIEIRKRVTQTATSNITILLPLPNGC